MRTKSKSFLEDTFILFIIGLIIYAIYSFFFSSNENEKPQEPKVTIEEKVENPLISETLDYKMKNDEPILEDEKEIKEEVYLNPVEQRELGETNIDNEIKKDTKTEAKTEAISDTSKSTKTQERLDLLSSEKKNISNLDSKDQIEIFYQTIRADIYKNIEINPLSSGESLNIKLTILKSGKYEQLVLDSGKKEYFNQIKPAIAKAFPVQIDENLKDGFPRYFRMKIENN